MEIKLKVDPCRESLIYYSVYGFRTIFSLSLSLSRLVSFGPLFHPPVLVSNGNSQASFFSLISFSSIQGF